jgi:dihydrolipoamide dehydrogenase
MDQTNEKQEDKIQEFDVIVIGGGPGGYPAAIKAAQKGRKVALIEAQDLGGTCLNRGCIPSKTLIANAEVLQKVREAEEYGILIGSVSFDFDKMVKRKDDVVARVRKSLEGLIKSNKIILFKGFGRFVSPKLIEIQGESGTINIRADKVIIATGSEPRNIPQFPFDYERIHDSTSLLNLKELPKKIVIVGGGVIGCEFASLYQTLDVDVTIIEMMPRIIPMETSSISAALKKAFDRKGIKILTNALVESIEKTESGIIVRLAGNESIEADIALVSVGRKLNTDKIGLENAGVIVQQNGMIPVNDKMETNVSGIYAVGDIASKWWLAHVASHQGLVAANNACGHFARMNYKAVPSVIFTVPEIGTVGLTLEEAIEQGYPATVGAFPFQALGKSQTALETDGFAQIITDRRTGQILGAQVVGHEASTLVAEMAVAISNELTVESITETIHAHPTVAEIWLEAALMATDSPLHLPPKKIAAKE